jgi:DNA recombination protein RmuC
MIMTETIILLVVGVFVGVAVAWLLLRQRHASTYLALKQQFDAAAAEAERLRNDTDTKNNEIIRLTGLLASAENELKNLRERAEEQKSAAEKTMETMKTEFRNLANEIMEEKSKKFTEHNREKLDEILRPLNDNMKDFRRKIEETYVEGEKTKASLMTRLRDMETLNRRISDEATALTRALKGDSQSQGKWGEMILESILEKSGLVKDREFTIQEVFRGEGSTHPRPDVVVRYPGNRSIVIDSKVSLTAYERYVSAEDEATKETAIKDHLSSVRSHISQLSAKNYQQLYGINSLDFVMMFMPVEPAYMIAIQQDPGLWNLAYEKRILMIGPTNLIAALKMIESMWRQEYQSRHVMEIAEQGGALYDDFVTFVERLQKIGRKIDDAKDSYEEALKKLSDGRGNLIGRVEKLRFLGIKAKKKLPEGFKLDILTEEENGSINSEDKPETGTVE